jgi:hypothetical protein
LAFGQFINTDITHLRQAISDSGFSAVSAPLIFREWLAERNIPNDLASVFKDICFVDEFDLGVIYLSSFKQIMQYHENEPIIIESGFLQVGSATNGDPVVLDLKSGSVGYLDHDLLWEDALTDLKGNFRFLASSLGSIARGCYGLWSLREASMREMKASQW